MITTQDTKQDEDMKEVWGELAEKIFAEFISGKFPSISWITYKEKITEAIK